MLPADDSTSDGLRQACAVPYQERLRYLPSQPSPRTQSRRFSSQRSGSYPPSPCRIALPEDVGETPFSIIPGTPSVHRPKDYNTDSMKRSSLLRRLELNSCLIPRTPPSPPTNGSLGPWHGRSSESTSAIHRRGSSLSMDEFHDSVIDITDGSFQARIPASSGSLGDRMIQQPVIPRVATVDLRGPLSLQSPYSAPDSVQKSLLGRTTSPNGLPSFSPSGSSTGIYNPSENAALRMVGSSDLDQPMKPFDLARLDRAADREVGASQSHAKIASACIAELWEKAIYSHDVQKVADLLYQGLSPNGDRTLLKAPLLILAVMSSNEVIVKLLLSAGADINCIDNKKQTALHHAAAGGQRNLVRLLLVAGANLYARSEDGLLPLELATDSPTLELITLWMRSDMEGLIVKSQRKLSDSPPSAAMKQYSMLDKDTRNLQNNPSFEQALAGQTEPCSSTCERMARKENVLRGNNNYIYSFQAAMGSLKQPIFLKQGPGSSACQASGTVEKHVPAVPEIRTILPSLHEDCLVLPVYNDARLIGMDGDGKGKLDKDAASKQSEAYFVSGEGDTLSTALLKSTEGNMSVYPVVSLDYAASQLKGKTTVFPIDNLEAPSSYACSTSGTAILLLPITEADTKTNSEPVMKSESVDVAAIQMKVSPTSFCADHLQDVSDLRDFESDTGFHLEDAKDQKQESILNEGYDSSHLVSEKLSVVDATQRNESRLGCVTYSPQTNRVTGSENFRFEKRMFQESTGYLQDLIEREDGLHSFDDDQNISSQKEMEESTILVNDNSNSKDSPQMTVHESHRQPVRQGNVQVSAEQLKWSTSIFANTELENSWSCGTEKDKLCMDLQVKKDMYQEQTDAIILSRHSKKSLKTSAGIFCEESINGSIKSNVLHEEIKSPNNVKENEEGDSMVTKALSMSEINHEFGGQVQKFKNTQTMSDLQVAEPSQLYGRETNADVRPEPALKTEVKVKIKDMKQVKFATPLGEDLALIREDWHDAARNGCTGCGKEGCGGNCLPHYAGYQKHKVETSQRTSLITTKMLFSNTERKTVESFDWKKGELLGEGAYGKVFAGLNQSTGELMAVKQLKLVDPVDDQEKSFYLASLHREITLYKEMRHKHIVGYIGMEQDEASGSLYIFLEYVSGGSIQSMLERFGPFNEELVRVYTRQLLLGLEYLHKNKIVHRDIKGGNVLVDSNGIVKLGDFGASKVFHDPTITDGCKSIRGSVFWMAPEVIKGDGYGRRADIWSVGCTVIEMLTAMHPWPTIDNTWAAIFYIAKASNGPPVPENASECAKDFLKECFNLNPRLRPSSSQLLQHKFVTASHESSEFP